MFFDPSILFSDEDIAPKPQQKRSTEKQEAIFEAAAKLFAEKGYHGTNTKEIAEKAGVSIGTLYFKFTDKRQILLSLFAQQASRYANIGPLDVALVKADPLAYFSDQLKLGYPYSHLYYSISNAIRELIVQDEPLQQRFGLLREAVFTRICEIVDVAIKEDMAHPKLVVEPVTQSVTNFLFNMYLILPNPKLVTEEVYWARHQVTCEMVIRLIFRDEFVKV